LRFDAGGDEFPSPLVDVIVSGQPTSMIVDTGASHHIVASWIAGDAGTSGAPGGAGIDHAGKTVQLARFEGGNLVVSGWGRVPTPETLVAALPAALQRHGIGGVLSPQTLVDDSRAVTLDFRKNTMTDAPVDEALRALAAQPGTEMKGEVRDCNVGGHLMFVKATIGGQAVEAQIDTGATSTTVQAASEAGKALRPRAKGQASAVAASGVFTVPAAEGVRVAVGAFEMDTTVDLVPGGAFQCGNSAFLGMDVLRRCVMVVGAGVFAAKCTAPPPP
jgi:predicted aspartyl protease